MGPQHLFLHLQEWPSPCNAFLVGSHPNATNIRLGLSGPADISGNDPGRMCTSVERKAELLFLKITREKTEILGSEMEVAYRRHVCTFFYFHRGLRILNSSYELDSCHSSNSVLGVMVLFCSASFSSLTC